MVSGIIDPGGKGMKVDTLWAILIVHDKEGADESVAAAMLPETFPLVATDSDQVEKIVEIATRSGLLHAVRRQGKRAILVRFDTRQEVRQLI